MRRRSFFGVVAAVVFGGIPKPELFAAPLPPLSDDAFFRKIMPPVQLTNEELGYHAAEAPANPAALSIPFACLPIKTYIRGPRYCVSFDRIVTPRFTKGVGDLRTWRRLWGT